MIGSRTSVGLDVHARSVVACGLDGQTGELFERRLTPDHWDVAAWVRSLPGPVGVTYEAGPTGFGLARFLAAEGIGCLVAAPSMLQRPAGDRVKTDAGDSEFTPVVTRLGCLRGVSTLTSFVLGGGDRGLDPALGPLDRRLPGVGASAAGDRGHGGV